MNERLVPHKSMSGKTVFSNWSNDVTISMYGKIVLLWRSTLPKESQGFCLFLFISKQLDNVGSNFDIIFSTKFSFVKYYHNGE